MTSVWREVGLGEVRIITVILRRHSRPLFFFKSSTTPSNHPSYSANFHWTANYWIYGPQIVKRLVSNIRFLSAWWSNYLQLLLPNINFNFTHDRRLSLLKYKKVKHYHYTPGQALKVPAGWGSQILRQSTRQGGKVVSPRNRPPLLPPPPKKKNIPGTHFC